jgi:cytidylate kinase
MAIITISRGTYSGGKTVAEQLAHRLGYECLSRELMTKEACIEFDLNENEVLDAMDESPSIISSDRPISSANVNFVRATLLKRVRSLELVYHGLAGDILLRGVKKMLRVRILAGQKYRIKAAMNNNDIDHETAVKIIHTLDKKRDKWAQVVLGTEWSDPSLYDVAFNLDYMSVDSVVDTLVRLSKREEFTADASTTKSLENLILSSNVWAALAKHKPSWALHVYVVAQDGVVSLYGDVASRKFSDAIQNIVSEVKGVNVIENNINVGSKWLW